MGILDGLTQQPQNVTNTSSAVATPPSWYQDYLRGIGGRAMDIGSQDYTPYPNQRLADFTPDQQQAMQQARANQGDWKPALAAGTDIAGSISSNADARLGQGANYASNAVNAVTGASNNANQLASQFGGAATGIAGGAGTSANAAVAGPSQQWTNNYQQYMSPYTSGVVDEIGRLGNRNLMENIIPGVQNQFLGAGQFGSTRNADILGRSVRDAQADISGKQAQALESGYGTAANIFGQDAGRQQQQQQMQAQTALGAGSLGAQTQLGAGGLGANTALSGGQMVGNTGIAAANNSNQAASIGASAGAQGVQALSGLAQQRQTQGAFDNSQLYGYGTQQQNLQQTGLNTGYQDFINQRDWDKNNLTWMNGALKGLSVPSGQTVSNTSAGASPLDWATAGYGALQSGGALSNTFDGIF